MSEVAIDPELLMKKIHELAIRVAELELIRDALLARLAESDKDRS